MRVAIVFERGTGELYMGQRVEEAMALVGTGKTVLLFDIDAIYGWEELLAAIRRDGEAQNIMVKYT